MRDQKGITLIALIITIIVMLILVAVTVSVALNGGLFNNASDAKVRTQKAADREELLSAIYGTLNNTGNLQIASELGNKLQDDWDVVQDSTNSNYYKCTSGKGNVFYVDVRTGKISDTIPEESIVPGAKQITIIGESSVTIENGETDTLQVALPSGIETENVTWTSSSNSLTVTPAQNKASATIEAGTVAESTIVTVTVACPGVTSAVFTITINPPEEPGETWYNVTFKNLDPNEIGNMEWEDTDMYIVGFKTKDDISVLFIVANGLYDNTPGYYYGYIMGSNNILYQYPCVSPWTLGNGTLGGICEETINLDGTMTFEKLKLFEDEDYSTYGSPYVRLSSDLYSKFMTLTQTTPPTP